MLSYTDHKKTAYPSGVLFFYDYEDCHIICFKITFSTRKDFALCMTNLDVPSLVLLLTDSESTGIAVKIGNLTITIKQDFVCPCVMHILHVAIQIRLLSEGLSAIITFN